jgi:hypothetical protein
MADTALSLPAEQGNPNDWSDVTTPLTVLESALNLAGDSAIATESGLSLDGSTTRRDYATVATAETTASTTWADLATPGPSVTITVPSNSLVLIGIEVAMLNSTSDNNFVGVYEATDFPISGAPDLSETTGDSGITTSPQGPGLVATVTTSYTTLPFSKIAMIPATAGSRTYTLKYAVIGGTATFKDRKIWALALGGF